MPNSLLRPHDQGGIVGERGDVLFVPGLGVAGLVEGGEEFEDGGCGGWGVGGARCYFVGHFVSFLCMFCIFR